MKRVYVICIGVVVFLIVKAGGDNSYDYSLNTTSETISSEVDNPSTEIYVQVTGAVEKPGLYEMNSGDRVNDLLLEAGASKYNSSCINLAQKLVDEQNLYIPSSSEACVDNEPINDDGIVNINTASSLELETISGIGESKANSIVEYREQNGSFLDTEDLINVDGISEGLLASISPQISLS